jgi:hypothetical protein
MVQAFASEDTNSETASSDTRSLIADLYGLFLEFTESGPTRCSIALEKL